jgi:uncharacterized protein YcfL
MKKLITLLMLTAVVLTGCKTKERVVEHYKHDTLTVDRWQRDSIYVELLKHDSVTIREKGDTVLIEKWHTQWRDRWRDREVHDSIYISKVDTVTVVQTEKPSEALTKWQKFRIKLANVLLWVVGIGIAWGIFRIVKKQLL